MPQGTAGPACVLDSATKLGYFQSPSYPDFSSQAPDGYAVGSDIELMFYAFNGDPRLKRTPYTAKVVTFDSDDTETGVTLFGESFRTTKKRACTDSLQTKIIIYSQTKAGKTPCHFVPLMFSIRIGPYQTIP
jgi:hypothetical protein